MAWYEEAIFYHIYPLGLCGAEKQNTYEGISHRLNDCLPWVDHLVSLGCNALYISSKYILVENKFRNTVSLTVYFILFSVHKTITCLR